MYIKFDTAKRFSFTLMNMLTIHVQGLDSWPDYSKLACYAPNINTYAFIDIHDYTLYLIHV